MRLLASLATAAWFALAMTACTDITEPTPVAVSQPNAALIPLGPVIGPLPPRLGPNDFVEISAGGHHTCARKLNNTVYCWGIDDKGQSARWTMKTCASGVVCVDRPTLVNRYSPATGSTPLLATTIESGYGHSCVVDPNQDAYCWGDGNNGQVGFAAGSYGYQYEPMPVVGGLKFTSLGAGTTSTCGTTTGGMYCWGRISNQAATPTQVSSWNGYGAVTVGDQHACALYVVGSYRAVDCWGRNHLGELGYDPALLPVAPFTVSSGFGTAVNRAVTEFQFTCVDQVSGIVQCAGENTWGQLGNGVSGTYNSTGTPQTVGGGMQLRSVTTSMNHACALDITNRAYCWGNGYNGQVGNGGSGVFTAPQAVTGGRTYRAIAAGQLHTCAIGSDNHIYCWGGNAYGQLGTQYPGGWVMNPVQALDPAV
jgi:alpha-tubulin suppressor-like RCC1 family protein